MNSVLITGGSGFLGHGLVEAMLRDNLASRICIYSRGEFAQSQMRQRFKDDQRLRWFVGDCRDASRLQWACQGIDTVIHAAALKRVEVGRYNPEEMVKTNVLGTMNTIQAARSAGVERFIIISSDKAFEPISPYGQSKALGESLVLASNNTRAATGTIFSAVRYGNVLGSTGSVIPLWRDLKEKGEFINVTDLECTRFAMLRGQACGFILKAIEVMKGGELFVPNLPAFSLATLVEAMDIQNYNVLGLPVWEKKHESMALGNSSDKAQMLNLGQLRQLLADIR